VDFALPTQYRLRNRLTGFPDRIHIHASGASPLHDRLDITVHADEQDWEPGDPSRSVCRDLDVVEANVHHDVQSESRMRCDGLPERGV
jgi:hypothetical protein